MAKKKKQNKTKQSKPPFQRQGSLQSVKTVFPKRRRVLLVVGVLLALVMWAFIWRWRSPVDTKVLLDQETFPLSRYREMQMIADKVALTVDQVIPGQVESFPDSGIVCYIAPKAWNDDHLHPPPITLVGPKQNGEPESAHQNTVRIAVNDQVLSSTYAGEAEFVFELTHELAHVKMDARYDNYLVETFAVAVSLKVLRELGYNQYRNDTVRLYTHRLPEGIQSAIERKAWNEAALQWQSEIPKQKSGPSGTWDFSFAMLGSILLEAAQQPVWPNLLGVGRISEKCVLFDGTPVSAPDAAMRFKVCLPAIRRMNELRPALTALAYP